MGLRLGSAAEGVASHVVALCMLCYRYALSWTRSNYCYIRLVAGCSLVMWDAIIEMSGGLLASVLAWFELVGRWSGARTTD